MRTARVAAAIATIATVLGAGAALGLGDGSQGSTERVSTLRTDRAAIFDRLDVATGAVLAEGVAVTVGRGHPELDATAAVRAASHGPFIFHVVRSTTAGRVCWVASQGEDALSAACGPRDNIADGLSMSLVVPGDPEGRGAAGFDFLVVPDGFDQVIGPLGASEVHDNVAVVPREAIGGPREPRSFRRAGSREILRIVA